MSPADRAAADQPEPDPVLTSEEAETLAELGPSDAALAAIAADEARAARNPRVWH